MPKQQEISFEKTKKKKERKKKYYTHTTNALCRILAFCLILHPNVLIVVLVTHNVLAIPKTAKMKKLKME